ncbi:hypothetical protein [Candidimonas nitroreducens]|uniref:Uncharacterized protein n=1 Tax=Candidimonas nitroreducens TaxID=683354 RepID=A0A225M1D2_9BURK|nr:hypothetical protein [Candidimonas nitroreducens]OWT55147.1 hypothetical protein CEY11_20720 [Candidimonas nitroreducens]
MNDSNRHAGPNDGDYASYLQQLNAPANGSPATPGGQRAAEPQAGQTHASGYDHGAAAPASPAQQQAEPRLRAPRFIGTLLIIAAWVLFFVALWLGIQAWHARTGHMDEWLPAGFALIAARLLLAMGKAARNPRVQPQDPEKSFPEHIEY